MEQPVLLDVLRPIKLQLPPEVVATIKATPKRHIKLCFGGPSGQVVGFVWLTNQPGFPKTPVRTPPNFLNGVEARQWLNKEVLAATCGITDYKICEN